MKNSQKGFIVPLVIAIFALLAIGGGVYVFNNKKAEAPVVDTGKQEKDTQNPAVNTQTNNSGREIYTNAEYGFTFNYPSNLFVNKSTYGGGNGWWFITQEAKAPVFAFEDSCGTSKDYLNVLAYKDFTTIGMQYQTSDKYIKVIEDNYKNAGGRKIYDTTEGDTRIVKFDSASQYGQHELIFKGKALLDISYQKCAGGSIPFDDIVSTFKFTYPTTQADTLNWKTATNAEIGFSLKYPSNWLVDDALTLNTCCLNITSYNTGAERLLSGQTMIQVQRYTKLESQSLTALASLPDELTGISPKVGAVTVAGLQGVKSNALGDGIYYLPKSETEGIKVISWSYPDTRQASQIFTQKILSTFKFTK